ncbi:helix-turn-helix domain-containing protein [Mycobacterium sp. NPDC050853]|uniref:helix-turn-helix domain-containing protein n=1 Tax=Mycobacterium sp. NPDC050853 TaxID=3155160 RepID=UPI0033E66886
MDETERILTPIPECCTVLGGISRTTVYELINQGLLTRVNIGARAFITAESILEYVRGLCADQAVGQGDVGRSELATPDRGKIDTRSQRLGGAVA